MKVLIRGIKVRDMRSGPMDPRRHAKSEPGISELQLDKLPHWPLKMAGMVLDGLVACCTIVE